MSPVFTPPAQPQAGCDLCTNPGGLLLWSEGDWRAVRVEDAAHPAFYRVICNRHVREFSDLSGVQRSRCMDLVCAIEQVLIAQLNPTKINLAAFGNMVPHLHWHVMARFDWDDHFPNPIWGARTREPAQPAAERLAVGLDVLDAAVLQALANA
ncbi:HIT family protein [Albitalea terrae]|uniref:HIT family protein n=2 Tax=Piscinibacter terrae TaxID=2496871 RepID=A0A3N7HZH9_9BURK|nr:HIT family protein [Albitalea terrae]